MVPAGGCESNPAYCCVTVARGSPSLSFPDCKKEERRFEALLAFLCMEKARPPGSWRRVDLIPESGWT